MKTFATLCLTAAIASAWGHKDPVKPEVPAPAPEPIVPEPATMEEIETPEDQGFWDSIHDTNSISRNLWLGIFSGLYGMTGSVDRPTEDCFGEWIPEKMQQLSDFRAHLHESLFDIDMDEAATASYNMVDLIFLNDRYCHFRQTLKDLNSFCNSVEGETPCAFASIMENAQKNAFSIITEVGATANVFKTEKWGEMDAEARGNAVNELAHSFSKMFSELVGFNTAHL